MGRFKNSMTHYVFEFFMVFLAVFCGFLADNERENIDQRQTERKYMKSLLEDVRNDTVEIDQNIDYAEIVLNNIDSLILFLYYNPPRNAVSDQFLKYDYKALLMLNIIFTDRTAWQLKSSGSMRLITKTEVSDAILDYWKHQEEVKINLERYLIYRNRAREYSEKLFYMAAEYMNDNDLLKEKLTEIPVISHDPDEWKEFQNIVSHCGVVASQYKESLIKLHESASRLIILLRKDYPR